MHNVPTATEVSIVRRVPVRGRAAGTSHRQDVIMSFSGTITPHSDTADTGYPPPARAANWR